jgi:hypothetical protein
VTGEGDLATIRDAVLAAGPTQHEVEAPPRSVLNARAAA